MFNRRSLWLRFISYKIKVFVETSKTLMTPMPYFLVNVMFFRIICQDDTANTAKVEELTVRTSGKVS